MAAEAYLTGAAANVTSTIIVALYQKLNDVIELEGNLQILDTDFSTLESLLSHIRSQFQDQQKRLEEPLEKCLKNMDDALGEAKDLIDRAKRHGERGWCLRCCCFLCNPNMPTQIRAWKTRFDGLFQNLDRVFATFANAQQVLAAAAHREDLLLQPVPDSGYIGLGIRSAQDQLQRWLTEPHCQSPVIGVHGMGGVGKTSLLKVIYNNYKEEVSGIFDFVLWFVVSQNFQSKDFQIKELQASIAKQLRLNLEEISDIEGRKMRLYASLHKKKFLIVLDDIWSPIDLIDKVGVRFGDHNQSKIIISTRKKEVIERMGAIKYSVNIRPLTIGEGWDLFKRGAFTNGVLNESNIEEAIAKEIAAECKGLPLAINAVAAAMSCKETNEEWRRALNMMRNADPSFPNTHSTIDAELYQKLRWSYNDLSDPNLKLCFLYCAAFPEDAPIPVKDLVQMWSGEGLVSPRGTTNFMDIGRDYIDVLVKRCLVEYSEDDGHEYLKVHDVLRDMAIYVGQKEEKWLFAAGQHLKNFPSEEQTRDCKRISIIGNDIHDLPMDLKCPNLVSLMLAQNEYLEKVPEGFLSNLTCVRVLDLSTTSISSLPTSVEQLGQLEFLDLGGCSGLKDLPDSICNLSRLQFLNLEWCSLLHSLPSGIGELTNLKHLNLEYCARLVTIPHGIFQLTSLNKLVLPQNCTVRAGDLANLSNLMELQATVKAEIDTMGPWLDMRALQLTYKRDADTNGDDVVEDSLPESLKHMKKLETLQLDDYPGLSLPNCICEFQNMKNLILKRCRRLRELPALEIGSESAHASFPMLERLELSQLEKLESIAGPSNVLNEKAMPHLQHLVICQCPFAKKLISATEKLPNLKRVRISNCYKLEELDFASGSFQMLRYLDLFHLYGLRSIGGSLNIWNEGTLPKLQELRVVGSSSSLVACSLLRKLPLGMEKLSNLKIIEGDLDWWQSIIWEDDEMKIRLSQLFRAV